jgi:quinoprotein glucose dehydrogenase
MSTTPVRTGIKPGAILFGIYLTLVAILALALIWQGASLAFAGGSIYYVAMGLALLASTVLFASKRKLGLLVFALASVVTIAWTIWESGFDGWGSVPRLAWLIAVSGALALFWKVVKHRIPGIDKRLFFGSTVALPIVMLLMILIPINFPASIVLADAALTTARPADTFSRSSVASPDNNVAASHDDTNWTAYAGSNLGLHYSSAAQITPENASQLQKVWEYHHGDLKQPGERIAYLNESTPLKIGDSLYTCTPKQMVVSINAQTGTENWRFDPKTEFDYLKGGGANCRGVSYYRVPNAPANQVCAQRIIWGTADSRLLAIDALTGSRCTQFGTNGEVDLKPGIGDFRPGSNAVTSAPAIIRGTVIVGGQVIDSDVRPAPSGVVRGFDANTGALKWAFDLGRPGITTAPKDGETYTLSSPNSWAPISADDELGLVYVSLGNPAGDFYGGDRTDAENAYGSSLVALDAQTGHERWKFQTVHHDLWDYDLSPQAALIDFPDQQGTIRPALIQATKSAQIFVLDRATGKPLVDVTEMAVPQGTAPGDFTSPTQPVSLGMPNTMGRPSKVHEVLTEASTWGLTPFDQMACRKDFVQARYEGMFTPAVVGKNSLIYPGHHGGLNWGGVMVDPARGLLLVNNQRLPYMQSLVERQVADAAGAKSFQKEPGKTKGLRVQEGQPYAATKGPWMSSLNQPCIAPPWGFISGIDLRTTEVIWSRPFGTGYDAGPMGIASHTKFEIGTPSDATGVITAGGVTIIGAAIDNFMRVFNSQTGELLWEYRLPAGNQAAPLSYIQNGRQYVVAVVGGHDRIPTKLGDSIIAWALPETSK